MLELFPFFGFPALLIIGGGFMILVRDTEDNKRTGTRVFGVVLAFIGVVWIVLAVSYFDALGTGMGGGSRSSENEPKTANGRICKEHLLTNYLCDPWLWGESTVPTDPVKGVCMYGDEETLDRFDAPHSVRFTYPCNYVFRCVVRERKVADLGFSFAKDVVGRPQCERENLFPAGEAPKKHKSLN